ncbi:hypothetical protein A3K64_01765 [Candidatus Micrarchaeota archaeon RBG_16_36_9]|nr:MAG: hypothetical protein A3K64_01765 [Candidatus Micrarchaeota archaeon RBG_16_36_9]
MSLNFKKISAIAASTLMVGLTMGVAAAANYPAPFVAGGSADVAVVYGTGSGVSPLDLVQAGNIQSNLQSYMSGSGSSTTVTGGDYWQVGTSSDDFEIGESIKDVASYVGEDELGLLADQTISNEKGDSDYHQFLYFEDVTSSYVTYTEDDDDNIGLFFKVNSGQVIARYVMDFTTDLKSDVETDLELSDIEDKSITFLGKTYTIVTANNGTSGVELTLMSGALGGTVTEGTPLTIGVYTVSVIVTSATEAAFTVTSSSGTETTDKMAKGDMEKLADGNYIAITDVTWEGYAEGDQSATFYIGADKIEWKNATDMKVNGETINEAGVTISTTYSSGDVAISEIAINMTAEDDLYVPVNGKLSQASDLDEPEVLVSQNWDIEFKGLEATEYEDISLKVSESDQQYTLKYLNYDGDEVTLPLVFTNASGVYGGDDSDKRLVLDAAGTVQNITYKDYFLLHTADPIDATKEAKTVLVQYKGADKVTDTNPKVSLTVNPGPNQEDKEVSLSSTGTFTLKVAGGTFNFVNESDGTLNNFDIRLSDPTGAYAHGGPANLSMSNYIRTKYNTLINITDSNVSGFLAETTDGLTESRASDWSVNISVDDGNRDGDHVIVAQPVFAATISNTTADASMAFTGTSLWQTDPSNSDVMKYISNYGVEVTKTDPSDSPANIEVKVPKDVVTPLIYVSTGDLVVSSTSGSSTQLGDVLVKDSEVSSVSSKNLIVVGGSCINSVAASLLGGALCSADFTTKTGIGSGQFLIQSLASTYSSGKTALLVSGYEAADTVNAATYLRTKTVDTTVGKKYKGTSATTAELVVA